MSDKKAKTVAKSFQESWVVWVGPPETVMHDMGGEFEGDSTAKVMQLGCASRVAGTETHWQNAMAERHGGVPGDIVEAIVEELQLVGEEDMAQTTMWPQPQRTGELIDQVTQLGAGCSERMNVFRDQSSTLVWMEHDYTNLKQRIRTQFW